MKLNENYQKLPGSYLFRDIAQKQQAYKEENPQADIISLGIGDVTQPLAPAVIAALHEATEDMATAERFEGYPPAFGYDFLLKSIQQHDYAARGVQLEIDEIFVSDGAKSDCGNIGGLFDTQNVVAICDPVYPAYVDTTVMSGRAGERSADGSWSDLVYLRCTEETDFLPLLPQTHADLIYLCSPNNPTGATLNRAQLTEWVNYANEHGSIILFDGAYEAFITEDLPRSIYEIPGAKTCAIELRSFSKTAGFTGVRCGYTVVPKALQRNGVSLNAMWARRQSTKFNGVSYITQRAANAIYSEAGQQQVRGTINAYLDNAKMIYNSLTEAGFACWGAKNSPYVWLAAPKGKTSWELFDLLLKKAQVVGTPGSGFGPCGEGYFRLTGFNTAARTQQAVQRIREAF